MFRSKDKIDRRIERAIGVTIQLCNDATNRLLVARGLEPFDFTLSDDVLTQDVKLTLRRADSYRTTPPLSPQDMHTICSALKDVSELKAKRVTDLTNLAEYVLLQSIIEYQEKQERQNGKAEC